jgi:hypothetical protein
MLDETARDFREELKGRGTTMRGRKVSRPSSALSFAALGVGLPLLLCIQATLRSIIVLLLPALSLRHLQIHFSFFTELFHK